MRTYLQTFCLNSCHLFEFNFHYKPNSNSVSSLSVLSFTANCPYRSYEPSLDFHLVSWPIGLSIKTYHVKKRTTIILLDAIMLKLAFEYSFFFYFS